MIKCLITLEKENLIAKGIMKYLYYFFIVTVNLYPIIHTMELNIPLQNNTCTFITNDAEPQHIKVPLALAQQCATINNQIKDLRCTAITFPTQSSTEDTLKFISYLKKIKNINQLATNQSSRLKLHNRILAQHLQTFNDTELINLTLLLDNLEAISETDKNPILINEVSKRISAAVQDKEKIKPFFIFNNKAVSKFIMEQLTKVEKVDSIFIKLYSDLLTQQLPFPRTEGRIESIKTKICNCWSWETIRYKPRYINTTTGTIIKVEEIVDSKCRTIRTTGLKIFKKNNAPVIIQLAEPIKITQINANTDESLFICQIASINFHLGEPNYTNKNTRILINPNNIDHPAKEYNACAFTQNNDEIYIKDTSSFGILNVKNDTFIPISPPYNHKKNITQITTNKQGTIVLLTTKNKLFISKKENNTSIKFNELVIKAQCTIKYIQNILLCPNNDILYISGYDSEGEPTFYITDLNKTTNYFLPYDQFPDHVGFPSNDILLLGYNTKDDHFFNLKTGNSWLKEKSHDSIGRLAFTTDFRSVEEIASDPENKYHNRRLTTKIIPLIDSTIIDTIKCLNSSYIPLSIYMITQNQSNICNLPPNEIKLLENQNEALKKIIAHTKTIINSDLSKLTTIFSYLSYYVKYAASIMTYYIKSTIIACLYIIGFLIISLFDQDHVKNNDTFKKIHNLHSFIDQLFWLVE